MLTFGKPQQERRDKQIAALKFLEDTRAAIDELSGEKFRQYLAKLGFPDGPTLPRPGPSMKRDRAEVVKALKARESAPKKERVQDRRVARLKDAIRELRLNETFIVGYGPIAKACAETLVAIAHHHYSKPRRRPGEVCVTLVCAYAVAWVPKKPGQTSSAYARAVAESLGVPAMHDRIRQQLRRLAPWY